MNKLILGDKENQMSAMDLVQNSTGDKLTNFENIVNKHENIVSQVQFKSRSQIRSQPYLFILIWPHFGPFLPFLGPLRLFLGLGSGPKTFLGPTYIA